MRLHAHLDDHVPTPLPLHKLQPVAHNNHVSHFARSRIPYFAQPATVFPMTRPGLATSAATTYGSQAHSAPWPFIRLLGGTLIHEPWALNNSFLPAPFATSSTRTGVGVALTMLGKTTFAYTCTGHHATTCLLHYAHYHACSDCCSFIQHSRPGAYKDQVTSRTTTVLDYTGVSRFLGTRTCRTRTTASP